MVPIVTQETNATYVHPECFDLPVFKDEQHQFMQSVWQLTTDELIQILNSGKIALTIWGTQHPPVRLEVLE